MFGESFAAFEPAQTISKDTMDQSSVFEASRAEAQQGEPSKEDVMAENRRLKSLLAVMAASRADDAEINALPKTPSRNAVARAHTTPRKRPAGRVGGLSSSQSKRARTTSTTFSRPGQGPIEALWSPGVTMHQRFDAARELSGAAAGGNFAIQTEGIVQFDSGECASAVVTPAESVWSSPAAQMITPPATKSPAKRKPARKSRAKKADKPQQASLQLQQAIGGGSSVKRPLAELYAANFHTLNTEEKCRVLIPLFNGVDPTAPPLNPPLSASAPTTLEPAINFNISTPEDDIFNEFSFGDDTGFTGVISASKDTFTNDADLNDLDFVDSSTNISAGNLNFTFESNLTPNSSDLCNIITSNSVDDPDTVAIATAEDLNNASTIVSGSTTSPVADTITNTVAETPNITPTDIVEVQEECEGEWMARFMARIRAENVCMTPKPSSTAHGLESDASEDTKTAGLGTTTDSTYGGHAPMETFNFLPEPDMGAARQREALEKAAMLHAQGRRRRAG